MANRADYEAAAYFAAHGILERLPVQRALFYLGRASVNALPYRPHWSELVCLAALLAGRDAVDPQPVEEGSEACPF